MVRTTSAAPHRIRTDLLVVPVWEGEPRHWNPAVAGWMRTAAEMAEFSGKRGEEQLRYGMDGAAAERIAFLGLGAPDRSLLETLRTAAGTAVGLANKRKLSDVAICLPDMEGIDATESDLLEALVEGALLANRGEDRFKSDPERRPVKTLRMVVRAPRPSALQPVVDRASAVCNATRMARDWVNAPSNHKRPDVLAAEIRRKAAAAGLKASVLGARRLEKLRMGALMAVGGGSSSPPALVILEYAPPGADRTVVLVGKGVTFDTGGYNLKPTGSMETMKVDMAGAAAVAATLIAAPAVDPGCRLVGVLPLAENMVSGNAYRPGDVVRTYAGKTVEIGNTDAEGRLILADAMAYAAKRFRPDLMIDLATLTGACVVALGESMAGVFSPDAELAGRIQAAGERVHERCWPLPLPEDYRDLLKSEVADIRNIGQNRWGGAILAALFLAEFAGDTPWAHIDIAGPAAAKKASAYCGPGGTGFGVRLLCRILKEYAGKP